MCLGILRTPEGDHVAPVETCNTLLVYKVSCFVSASVRTELKVGVLSAVM